MYVNMGEDRGGLLLLDGTVCPKYIHNTHDHVLSVFVERRRNLKAPENKAQII